MSNNIFSTKQVLNHILYYIWRDTEIKTSDVGMLEKLLCSLQSNELNVLYGTESDRDTGEPGGFKTARYEYLDGKRWQYTGHADMSRYQLYVFSSAYHLRISVYDTYAPLWEEGELIGELFFDYIEDDGYTEFTDFIDEIRDEMSDCDDEEYYSQLKKDYDDLVGAKSLADVISVITPASDDVIDDIIAKVATFIATPDDIIEVKIDAGWTAIKLFCNVKNFTIEEINFYRDESNWSMFIDERPPSIRFEYDTNDDSYSISSMKEKAVDD